MKTIYILLATLLWSSCDKFLDEKTSASLATPSTLKDLQALLDSELNTLGNYPAGSDLGADYYHVSDAVLKTIAEDYREGYLYTGESTQSGDWEEVYRRVFNMNVVLDNVDGVALKGLSELDRQQVKGAALFFRAWNLLCASFIYAPAYDKAMAKQELGLPLRTTADINQSYPRASLAETFDFIVRELKASAALLPDRPLLPTRASKPAAYAALARACLYMGDNEQAYHYADSCLQLKSDLMDYADIDVNTNVAFEQLNPEVILHNTTLNGGTIFNSTRARVDPYLYARYSDRDYRKKVFFTSISGGEQTFKGNYSGELGGTLFCGLATDEVYLTLAEGASRIGKLGEAKSVLKNFLIKRYELSGMPNVELGQAQLIELILEERCKQLAFRGGVRWMDIKRLNNLYDAGINLSRTFEGKIYSLPANDKRFAYLIPWNVISLGGIEQNPR